MAVIDRALVQVLPAVPHGVVRSISSRYIAGETLADASNVVRRLNRRGKMATIDVLGEEITNEAETHVIAQAYEDALAEIARSHLKSNVSVKPTALGLELDPELCKSNLRRLLHRARVRDNFVRIDMEDATTTDATLAVYRDLRGEGFDNVGFVLQASLKRSLADVDALADLRPNVRVCKGIYIESPEIQYREYGAVPMSFMTIVEALLDAGSYVGVATHDKWLIEESQRIFTEQGLPKDAYEFQMLLGVRPRLGNAIVAAGHRLRIYVPYGSHWYQYSLRRLQENPSIARYVAYDALGHLFMRLNANESL
jgi:proline dehydrogenase